MWALRRSGRRARRATAVTRVGERLAARLEAKADRARVRRLRRRASGRESGHRFDLDAVMVEVGRVEAEVVGRSTHALPRLAFWSRVTSGYFWLLFSTFQLQHNLSRFGKESHSK